MASKNNSVRQVIEGISKLFKPTRNGVFNFLQKRDYTKQGEIPMFTV